ncbi:unnamed protein product [Citrullus colocynthis]|uniref:Uncharacterized protein n=1 Tax=Citrullus colocynthis TaxID=252529 RepID=A0ABP0Y069_9ROSI
MLEFLQCHPGNPTCVVKEELILKFFFHGFPSGYPYRSALSSSSTQVRHRNFVSEEVQTSFASLEPLNVEGSSIFTMELGQILVKGSTKTLLTKVSSIPVRPSSPFKALTLMIILEDNSPSSAMIDSRCLLV